VRRLLAIDPGLATGWSAWIVPDDEPMQRYAYGLIQHGVDGFNRWFQTHGRSYVDGPHDVLVCEKFELGGDVRFPDVEPLRIEGVLIALSPVRVRWQLRTMKAQVEDERLKAHRLWVTGKDVGWTDGRDVNDSQIHALAWGKFEHYPTLQGYWPEHE
jgi:hypothetical protein